ncbi:chymotrypsin-2-like [Leptidea sinapis]|uniref:chymotrypsin-2-like n=1 Tax=Leptidea sinapis TaxID=189913 RepID=UPI00213E3406|nr:chymotrypsin-2-like [Leptidea sinapis]
MLLKVLSFVIFLIGNASIYGSPVAQSSDVTPHIVGGVEAPEGSAKHMVALVIGDIISSFTCGGSIITKRHVLTAAHCIQPYSIWQGLLPTYRGVSGSNNWNASNYEIKFENYIIHPKFNIATIKFDIGVLITVQDIIFNKRVEPISLNFGWVPGRRPTYITGWGLLYVNGKLPDRLQLLHVNTISPLQCILRVRLASIILGGYAPPVEPEIEICTLHSVGHGICFGDSGSAVVSSDTRQQIGVVSWVFPCGLGAPDVHVRVSGFHDFLMPIMIPYL